MADKIDDNTQSKYMELQMINQQMQQLEHQFGKIEEQRIEIEQVLESLELLKGADVGSEILVPVSSGIFSKASLVDNRNLLINVGAGVVVEKDVDGAKELVENQRTEILKFQQEVGRQMELLASKSQELETELKKLVG
ncbi:prefoldin subunit alpha [Candidatus Woesearchaeota archaeon]|nr:prefoldin subunit alpha [Candidatus Woesearchaeota archaeon]